jgi:transposase
MMPKERLSMRKIKEVLRLQWESKLSQNQIAASCQMARSTVGEYVQRAQAAGLSWPLPDDLEETQLEARLFPDRRGRSKEKRARPEFERVHQELKRKGVTLALLWMEYKAEHPDGYPSSRFCDLYRAWEKRLDPCMRQEHKAGEKLFVDDCGQTVPVTDSGTSEIREAQIFTAVLGASNYTYAEASWTQALPALQALSYKSIRSILHHGLDHLPPPEPSPPPSPLPHLHVRGPEYFH